uniref:Protein ENHANCED DISEASE RESISTANCE 2 C-terminal domain-containing protein n=1 Tax=Ditylum brightwellii TaxID=49249 RepID=A0A7S4RAP7_9STRA|mmetsp:Transcript_20802/g.30470  ORF Transcript_20802/g.30470 Transcript_20802/m.30470 type:complete len:610 (+) Transcript_20802:585-2414(+)
MECNTYAYYLSLFFLSLVPYLSHSHLEVNYAYTKSLGEKRQRIIDDVFNCILLRFPSDDLENPYVKKFIVLFEDFLLSDVIIEDEASKLSEFAKTLNERASKRGHKASKTSNRLENIKEDDDSDETTKEEEIKTSAKVEPKTTKLRDTIRILNEEQCNMKGKTFHLEEEEGDGDTVNNTTHHKAESSERQPHENQIKVVKKPTELYKKMKQLENPRNFAVLFAVSVVVLKMLSKIEIKINSETAALVTFLSFCIGMHAQDMLEELSYEIMVEEQSVSGGNKKTSTSENIDRAGLIKRAMSMTRSFSTSFVGNANMSVQLEKSMAELSKISEEGVESPMPLFPKGAKIGSVTNRWSIPDNTAFHVRGQNYLTDKKKIASGPFMFPARGVDLFLTDECPEDVGRNVGVFGGKLREKPTFIINFRLPWAVLLCYFEIPEFYLPFLRKRYEPDSGDIALPSLDERSPAERTVAQFLMGDDKHKDKTLKIVPMVVDGPWVVRGVVKGKPAILGTKMPVNYVYHPANKKKGHAEYLEADLDIVASSVARRILSVVKGYCSVLTMDLGFVIQGDKNNELPEQMLVGTRLHSVDPLTAPALPPMPQDPIEDSDDDTV